MTDEEKKAIKLTKTIIEFAGDSYIPKENRKALQVLLNLIETQKKEIVKLKKDYSDMLLQENVISKDKIKEKIKKYDEWIKEGGDYVESLEAQRYALNELLEE